MAFPNDGEKFEKGKTGNPNGRPKKSFAIVNQLLKEQGFERLTKAQMVEAMELIMNSDEEALKNIAMDLHTPMALRIMIKELANPKFAYKAIQDYRDWLFGSVESHVEKAQHITINLRNSDLISDEIK